MQAQLTKIVNSFVSSLAGLMESEAAAKVQGALDNLRDGKRNGARANSPRAANGHVTRKKPPRQLCPVPRCKNTAAPVFGMVCGKHKDLPKAQIKKFREARREKKAA